MQFCQKCNIKDNCGIVDCEYGHIFCNKCIKLWCYAFNKMHTYACHIGCPRCDNQITTYAGTSLKKI